MQKKILVTGGCGFIDANLVPKLIEGDVCDPSIVKNAVSGITLEDGIAKTWDWFSRNFSKS